jgi:hypothetical protein
MQNKGPYCADPAPLHQAPKPRHQEQQSGRWPLGLKPRDNSSPGSTSAPLMCDMKFATSSLWFPMLSVHLPLVASRNHSITEQQNQEGSERFNTDSSAWETEDPVDNGPGHSYTVLPPLTQLLTKSVPLLRGDGGLRLASPEWNGCCAAPQCSYGRDEGYIPQAFSSLARAPGLGQLLLLLFWFFFFFCGTGA